MVHESFLPKLFNLFSFIYDRFLLINYKAFWPFSQLFLHLADFPHQKLFEQTARFPINFCLIYLFIFLKNQEHILFECYKKNY